ncbi:MFS transporter [Marinomonas sp. TI.3.20]|uniref:MFS transporter n=1 Tax=Marinomonas sp. TI.3.20 TaxID=3121296 RepID=UPI00311FD200
MTTKESNALKYVLILVLGGLVFGIDAGVISGTVKFIKAQFELDSLQIGTVVSAPALGAIIALLFSGKVAHAIGRKKAMIIVGFLYLISAIGTTFAPNYEILIIARLIGGLGFCSITITTMYLGEITPANIRGRSVTINQVAMGLGFFIVAAFNYFLVSYALSHYPSINENNIWRYMFSVQIPVVAVWIFLLTKLPESPRWLMIKGYDKECCDVLSLVNEKEEMLIVADEIRENVRKNDCNLPYGQQFKLLFTPRMRTVLIIGTILAIAQPLVGMGAISYYTPTIFEQTGLSQNNAFLQTAIVGLFCVFCAVVSAMLVEKVGRRPILIFGLTIVVLSHAVISYSFKNATYEVTAKSLASISHVVDTAPLLEEVGHVYKSDVKFKNMLISKYSKRDIDLHENVFMRAFANVNIWAVLISIFAVKGAFFLSIGPLMWVVYSEIMPNETRTLTITTFSLLHSTVGFFVQKLFPWELANLGSSMTFFIFGACSLVGLLCLIFLLPETKGKSIEKIEELLVK